MRYFLTSVCMLLLCSTSTIKAQMARGVFDENIIMPKVSDLAGRWAMHYKNISCHLTLTDQEIDKTHDVYRVTNNTCTSEHGFFTKNISSWYRDPIILNLSFGKGDFIHFTRAKSRDFSKYRSRIYNLVLIKE